MTIQSMPPVAIVGAGPGGLSLARALRLQGVAFVAYERHSDVGGVWDPANPGSPIYDSAHFISSKTQSHFLGFPMPADYPDYPSHRQILAYIRGFADAYYLRRDIRFGVGVVSAVQDGAGWSVTTTTGETKRHSALVCVTGTNWHPAMPTYPGAFTGEMRHSNSYRSAAEFKGKRVLIIGAGNSGCDIACDGAKTADRTLISMRRGYHFIPKHIFGIPADEFAATGPQLPMWLEQRVLGALLHVLNGDVTRLGLPKPDHRIFETHPILNTQLLHFLAHGDIGARGDVARFDGQTVHFKDGAAEEVDLIIAATGFNYEIPYLDPAQFTWKAGRPDLYMNLFSRENPGLYALGLMETNGGAYKLFDQMADLVGRAIVTRAAGGSRAQSLNKLIASDRPDLSGGIKFAGSARHATYVEISAYRRQMRRLRAKMGWPDLDGTHYRAGGAVRQA